MTTVAYSAISSYSRVEILRLVQERPRRTIAELCEATGLHPNTVREHLHRLMDAGYVVVETERRTVRGRPRVLYSASGAAAASPIAIRKAEEAARRGDIMRRVLPATDNVALSREVVHQLDALVDDLADAGFDPVVDEDDLSVDLTPCAHAQAHPEHREVLCAVHLGLMDAVLTQAGGPLRVAGMRPNCDPANCVVRLSLG